MDLVIEKMQISTLQKEPKRSNFGKNMCAKDRKIKWSFQAKRRVDKEWENENFLRRKRTVIRRREEVENNQIDEET